MCNSCVIQINYLLLHRNSEEQQLSKIMVRQFSWLEYMPVTHGVAGSSPVRTAEILKRKFRDFLFSVASPQPSNIRFCGNLQKSAEQPSKQRDAPPGKSTTYGSRHPDSTDIGEARRADVQTQPLYAPSGKSTTWTRFQLTPDRVRGITPAQHAPQRGAAVYGWKRKKPVNPTSSVSQLLR